jgi:hypothetical protein
MINQFTKSNESANLNQINAELSEYVLLQSQIYNCWFVIDNYRLELNTDGIMSMGGSSLAFNPIELCEPFV